MTPLKCPVCFNKTLTVSTITYTLKGQKIRHFKTKAQCVCGYRSKDVSPVWKGLPPFSEREKLNI